MKMELHQLKIQNFMGCKRIEIDFGGANMKVFGDNASGKTTLMHAFNWLLFDKNAYGKADFGIKPLDESGEVIHRLETSVEVLFMVDGQPMALKKVFKEKWTRKRGSAEDTYSGNETSYYVNTVPKKKKEYTEVIAKLIDESVFRIITNPLHFNENMSWQDRRKTLLDICGNISDKEVIESLPELLPLLDILKGHTVEELKSIVTSEMKSINKELGIIPSRIAEAEIAKPTPRDDVDVTELEKLQIKKNDLAKERADIINGAEVLRLKAGLENAKSELKRKEAEKFIPHDVMKNAENDMRIMKAEGLIERYTTVSIPSVESALKDNKVRKSELSEKWDEIFKQAFLGDVCPTCKRPLPPEEVEAKKKEFNFKKATSLDAIEADLENIKKEDTRLISNLSELKIKLEKAQEELEASKKWHDELVNKLAQEEKCFNENKASETKKMKDIIYDLENEIIEKELNAEDLAKEVDVKIENVERQIAPITDYIAEQNMIKKQDARIEELKENQQKLSERYSTLDRQMFLIETFTRHKVSMINELVNKRFKYARFKLFNVQENGGIAETCEATYNGVPYRDLNTAGKVNIGLDIINTLSTSYGVLVPIFVDNMESISAPIDTLAQRIELIVSEPDKTLRFVKGE